MPLTDAKIRNAVPSSKTVKLFDGGGLYLEVSPTGGRWWRLKYRFGGKEKRLSLGVYPQVGLREARQRREFQRNLLGHGTDPSEHRKAERVALSNAGANTFETIAREWLAKRNWATGHSARLLRLFERDLFPWIGGHPIASITAPELLAVIRRIEGRGAVDTAHRALSRCGEVFRYGVATGRCERDLSENLRGSLSEVERGHFAAATEPGEFAKILQALSAYQGTFVVQCALRLAPLVFVRPGELRAAEWKDFDLEKAEWRYQVTKTGTQHIVPLSRQALEILRALHPLTGDGRFVFPCARSRKRPMSDNAILAAMRRMGIDKQQMTGHGFRAAARTILDEVLGVRPDFIEHQLAHTVRGPLGRAYNRTEHLQERRAMMQRWADYLDQITSGAVLYAEFGRQAG